MSIRSHLGFWVPLFSFGAAACGRSAEPPPTISSTTVTSAELTSDDAIIRLAAGRCERAAACNNVGPGKEFERPYDCVRALGKQTRMELRGAGQCRGRIHEARVDDCLLDVKYAGCIQSAGHLDRFAACRGANLCRLD